jgi:hypothetical protein
MNRREFLKGTAAAGTAAAVLPAMGSEKNLPDVLSGPIKPFIPKDPDLLMQLCERIDKQVARAHHAMRVVGKFSDEEVCQVDKWIRKEQEMKKHLRRDSWIIDPHTGRKRKTSIWQIPREIFIWPTISNVVPLDQVPIRGGREERIRIWDAICVSLKTIHDGFDLLGIDTWWENA